MNILLISPESKEDITNTIVRDIPYLNWSKSGAQISPLSLATVAALTPREHTVTMHDENIRGPVEELIRSHRYDIIGISTLAIQFGRTYDIAKFCKREKIPGIVVLGGPGSSLLPKGMSEVVDVIFHGEAEETWPQFLHDLAEGKPQQQYHHVTKPDMSKSPIPRWDLIREDMPYYSAGSVQTTRGCPFDCSFCDVIYIYGRKPRSKPVEQVLEEIRILESMGVRFVFIADDDFAGNKKHSKELLRALKPLNNSFRIPLKFMTQADLTIAGDEEMLELMADCNFVDVLIGVESENENSLKDLHKLQNLRQGVREGVKKVQSYGIAVLASMIIGADSDDKTTFKRTANFLKELNITDHFCYPLMAPYGTKLWYQFRREGRIVDVGMHGSSKFITNIVPKQLTRPELLDGLADYWDEVFHPLHFMERIIGFVKSVVRKPEVKASTLISAWSYREMLTKMVKYFLLDAGPDHRHAFFTMLRTTRQNAPYLLSNVLFLYSRFMINHSRAKYASQRARERAAYERAHPESVPMTSTQTPIPTAIRDHHKTLFETAYVRSRQQLTHKETLYQVVIESMTDYVDRFGEEFIEPSDAHHIHINESVDRILAKTTSAPVDVDEIELPSNRPPPGFAREILDALDSSLRSRELMAI